MPPLFLRTNVSPGSANWTDLIAGTNVTFVETPTTLTINSTTTNLVVPDSVTFSGDNTPAALAAGSTTNDYGGLGANSFTVRVSSAGAGATVTGMTGGVDGRFVLVRNVGNFDITLSHEGGGSAAANRFTFPGAANFTLSAGGGLLLWYDATSARWAPSGSTVTSVGFSVPRPIQNGIRAVLWDLATARALATVAPILDRFYTSIHVEEGSGTRTYSDMLGRITFNNPGAARFTLHALSATTGLPTTLLWYSASIDTNVGAAQTMSFAGGTWTAAGASFRDGSNRLSIRNGTAVAKSLITNTSNPTYAAINVDSVRQWIGLGEDDGLFDQRPSVLIALQNYAAFVAAPGDYPAVITTGVDNPVALALVEV